MKDNKKDNQQKNNNDRIPNDYEKLFSIARKSILVMSALGVLVSGYLFYAKLNTSALVCGISPCYIVNESEYSYLFGIPISAYGIAFYLAMFLFALLSKRTIVLILSVIGVLVSAYLTYLEFFVIFAWCMWCVTSAVLTVLILVVALFWFLKARTIKTS